MWFAKNKHSNLLYFYSFKTLLADIEISQIWIMNCKKIIYMLIVSLGVIRTGVYNWLFKCHIWATPYEMHPCVSVMVESEKLDSQGKLCTFTAFMSEDFPETQPLHLTNLRMRSWTVIHSYKYVMLIKVYVCSFCFCLWINNLFCNTI